MSTISISCLKSLDENVELLQSTEEISPRQTYVRVYVILYVLKAQNRTACIIRTCLTTPLFTDIHVLLVVYATGSHAARVILTSAHAQVFLSRSVNEAPCRTLRPGYHLHQRTHVPNNYSSRKTDVYANARKHLKLY